MDNTPTPADLEVPACPICGADVTEETGYADNFRQGAYQYASCSECTYQSDWPDHMRLHIFADPKVAYEAWARTIRGEFDMPHISVAFAAGYAAGQTLASASAVGVDELEAKVEELQYEAEIFDRDHADQNRMVDRIADLIGLPHDQELHTTAFELWFSEISRRAALEPKEPNHD